MHPEVEQEGPGKCPKCGMDLVPRQGAPEREPGPEDHRQMLLEHRRTWLWTNFAVMSLGIWLVSSPFTFGYADDSRMAWSDVISGVLLVAGAGAALSPRLDFLGRWGAALVGIWLTFAPLVFWARSPAAYLNDTLVGALVIALTILVPMMPGMAHHMEMMKPGPEIPPGWSYNPSSWHQRAPLIGLALLGWLFSRYLAAYQLGYIPRAADPFFGPSTQAVLTSDISRMWPVSDAGLGAFAYTLEMLMGWMGATTRWRTMPWMVTFFFILIVPLGLVHITLVILQPVAVGHWCTVCLAAASLMLLMIPLAVDEIFAMGQFLRRSVREGRPFWRTFWVGGTLAEVNQDDRTPAYGAPAAKMVPPMWWGVSVPAALLGSAALGLWLMFAPAVFGTSGPSADSDHLAGAVITTVAVISTAEVIRAGRYLNVVLGAWVMAAPWLLAGTTPSARLADGVAGALVIALSIPRGAVRERYAAWSRHIR